MLIVFGLFICEKYRLCRRHFRIFSFSSPHHGSRVANRPATVVSYPISPHPYTSVSAIRVCPVCVLLLFLTHTGRNTQWLTATHTHTHTHTITHTSLTSSDVMTSDVCTASMSVLWWLVMCAAQCHSIFLCYLLSQGNIPLLVIKERKELIRSSLRDAFENPDEFKLNQAVSDSSNLDVRPVCTFHSRFGILFTNSLRGLLHRHW
jgi:hypothetical protein